MKETFSTEENLYQQFMKGYKLAFSNKLIHFVLIPLIINISIFIGLSIFIYYKFSGYYNYFLTILPSWLSWLHYLLVPLFFLIILFIVSFFFSTIANWIASPFNGILAEKAEAILENKPIEPVSFQDIIKDIPRVTSRELQKLKYFFPRFIIISITFFIPGFGQTFSPIILIIFNAWMMSIQYCDYSFDNHKVNFKLMIKILKKHKFKSFLFGIVISFLSVIPIINLIIMPVAICSATVIWVENLKCNEILE